MSGTRTGGNQVRDICLSRDPDHYRKIGSKGGKISRGGGFTSKEQAKLGGQIGGIIRRCSPLNKADKQLVSELRKELQKLKTVA